MATPVERFLNADEEEQKMMARVLNEAGGAITDNIVEKRRKNYAETLSFGDGEHLSEEEAFDILKTRENQFISEQGVNEDGEPILPGWFLRLEAQDLIMEYVAQELIKEGLVDEDSPLYHRYAYLTE